MNFLFQRLGIDNKFTFGYTNGHDRKSWLGNVKRHYPTMFVYFDITKD